jgi:hypothetical protein
MEPILWDVSSKGLAEGTQHVVVHDAFGHHFDHDPFEQLDMGIIGKDIRVDHREELLDVQAIGLPGLLDGGNKGLSRRLDLGCHIALRSGIFEADQRVNDLYLIRCG